MHTLRVYNIYGIQIEQTISSAGADSLYSTSGSSGQRLRLLLKDLETGSLEPMSPVGQYLFKLNSYLNFVMSCVLFMIFSGNNQRIMGRDRRIMGRIEEKCGIE